MPLFEIKSRLTGNILFSLECGSLKLCVEAAIRRDANLRCADLSCADLCCTDLCDANLRDANLCCADLRCADLSCTDLRDANLRCANLRCADLRCADLCCADLRGANLRAFRDDIWAILSASPREVDGLRTALIEGRIDGSTYSGECCCLVGTLANERHCEYNEIPGLIPDLGRLAEVWFAGIKKGDTPETNQMSKQALEWVDDWLGRMKSAFSEPVC